MKSRNHRMLRPKSTALEESTQNHAKHPKMFRNRVTAWTAGQKTDRNIYIIELYNPTELQMQTRFLGANMFPQLPSHAVQHCCFSHGL